MGNLFSKKRVSKITDQDRAVLQNNFQQLKQQRDKLKQYQKRIETGLETDRNLAKALISQGKKDRAVLLLRKKRYQEQLLKNTDNQLQNLEQLTSDIEYAQIEVQVVEGLKVGNTALKDINATLDIDEIERILEESKEGYDKQQEINEILTGVLTQEDEEAVLEELDELVDQELKNLPNVAEESSEEALELPEVPESPIKIKSEKKPVAIAE